MTIAITTSGSELLQKFQIVFKQLSHVLYSILEHGDTLYTDARCQSRILLGVYTAVFQHYLIKDTAAQNLYPACAFAQRAAGST